MNKRQSNLLLVLYLSFALLSITVIPSCAATTAETAENKSSARKMTEEELDQCVDNLGEVDIDKDGKLSMSEYLTFVKEQSGGRYTPADQKNLDLGLLNFFLDQACECREKAGTASCCDKVDIATGTEQEAEALLKFCKEVEENENVAPEPSFAIAELDFNVQYSVKNSDGLTSLELMNNGKDDLIAATRTILIDYLNSTYTDTNSRRRAVENNPAKLYDDEQNNSDLDVNDQKHSNIRVLSLSTEHINSLRRVHSTAGEGNEKRRLEDHTNHLEHSTHLRREMATNGDFIPDVYYTDVFPIEITKINDKKCPSKESAGANCHLVTSKITVFHKSFVEDESVRADILDGLRDSFKTGAFNDALPT